MLLIYNRDVEFEIRLNQINLVCLFWWRQLRLNIYELTKLNLIAYLSYMHPKCVFLWKYVLDTYWILENFQVENFGSTFNNIFYNLIFLHNQLWYYRSTYFVRFKFDRRNLEKRWKTSSSRTRRLGRSCTGGTRTAASVRTSRFSTSAPTVEPTYRRTPK